MGFVVKEERGEGRESSGRPRAIVDVSRRYNEGARIGSSVLVRLLARSLALPPHGRIDRFKGILEGPDFLV